MREVLLSLVFLFGGVSAATAQEKASPSDDEVAKILIAESIAAYSGSCP